jgi:hypothetical protein
MPICEAAGMLQANSQADPLVETQILVVKI